MIRPKSSFLFRMLFLFTAAGMAWAIVSQPDNQDDLDSAHESAFAEENMTCLKCHGQVYYDYYNEFMDDTIRRKMCMDYRIDPELYYKSVHGSFRCTDCHSPEFEEYPHDVELRLEPKYECMDCHGGDDTYAEYNFDKIYEEYHGSVHLPEKGFTCWSCHNPHEYVPTARTSEQVLNTVAYNNAICLNCHGNTENYQLIGDKENPDIIEKHSWLPNQRAHFAKVRCIECHTAVDEEILVAHRILPGKEAVKDCIECHSTNSRLLASLYRHEQKEKMNKYGFFNGVILENSYVIGANRNYFLNVASVVLFGLIMLFVLIHIILRIYFRK